MHNDLSLVTSLFASLDCSWCLWNWWTNKFHYLFWKFSQDFTSLSLCCHAFSLVLLGVHQSFTVLPSFFTSFVRSPPVFHCVAMLFTSFVRIHKSFTVLPCFFTSFVRIHKSFTVLPCFLPCGSNMAATLCSSCGKLFVTFQLAELCRWQAAQNFCYFLF